MRIGAVEDELDIAMRACDELLYNSRAQRSAIAECNTSLLDELIEERGVLLASLDLAALGLRDGASLSETASAKRSLLKEKLAELLGIDEDNQLALQNQLAGVKSQLLTVNRGRFALQEYACVEPKTGPVYLDRRK